ncbi:MAG: hypothetical protein H7124_17370 [Phycisphaerales bacterium]|nr:hypothetical protein [Hyphomonadaceae bacterium]
MTREQFMAAKRVLAEGEANHSFYEIEDARRAIAPVKKGVGFMLSAILGIFFALRLVLEIALSLYHSPLVNTLITTLLFAAVMSLLFVRPFRERFIPVKGLTWREAAQVYHL